MSVNSIINLKKLNHSSWIIFDGDNTLWDVENLYNTARHEFCTWLAVEINAVPDNIQEWQRRRDTQLYSTMGYSRFRFEQSFIDTLTHYLNTPTTLQIEITTKFAQSVFKKKAKEANGIEEIFTHLKNNFKLGLLTAGDKGIQSKRIQDFSKSTDFEFIKIVDSKNQKTYLDIIEEFNIPTKSSWVIGDSLKSDVIPAKDSSFNTIWVQSDNWATVENLNHKIPLDIKQVSELHQILKIII